MLEPPCPAVSAEAYDEACAACEYWVLIGDLRTRSRLQGLLRFSKRGRGRALIADFPELGLPQLDRLEPTDSLPDVADFNDLNSFPVFVLFWRTANETKARHRNPVSSATGVWVLTLALDTLHTFHLGIYMAYCATVLWTMILGNPWAVGHTTKERLIILGAQRART